MRAKAGYQLVTPARIGLVLVLLFFIWPSLGRRRRLSRAERRKPLPLGPPVVAPKHRPSQLGPFPSRAGRLVLGWGSSAVMVALVLLTISAIIAPRAFNLRYGILRTGSMSPAIPAGSMIVVAPAGVADARPGDVITYRSAVNRDLLVTHRVVEVTTDESGQTALQTKGDANNNADATLVTADRLVGKVVFDLPELGRLATQIHSRLGFLVLLVLPTAAIIAIELRDLAGGVRDLWRVNKEAPA